MRPANPLELEFIVAAKEGNIAEMIRLLTISSEAYRLAPESSRKYGQPSEHELNLDARSHHTDAHFVRGIDRFHYSNTALSAAAVNGQTEAIRLLLSKNEIELDITPFRHTQLPGVGRRWGHDHEEENEEKPFDKETIVIDPYVDAPDLCQHTPLRYATLHKHLETVSALLELGAHVSPDLQQLTTNPEIKAILDRHAALQASEDRETKADRLHPYLHRAVLNDDGSTIHALVRAGADPSQQLINQLSPAVLAAHLGHMDAMLALLANGGTIAYRLDAYPACEVVRPVMQLKHPNIHAITRQSVFSDLLAVRGLEGATKLVEEAVRSAVDGSANVQGIVQEIMQSLEQIHAEIRYGLRDYSTHASELVMKQLVQVSGATVETVEALIRFTGNVPAAVRFAMEAASGTSAVVRNVVIAAKRSPIAIATAVATAGRTLEAVEAAVIAGGRTPEAVEAAVDAAGGTREVTSIALRTAGCFLGGADTVAFAADSHSAGPERATDWRRSSIIRAMRDFITNAQALESAIQGVSTGRMAAMCVLIASSEDPLVRTLDDGLDALMGEVRVAIRASIDAHTESRSSEDLYLRHSEIAAAVKAVVIAAGGGPAAITAALREQSLLTCVPPVLCLSL